MDLSSVSWAVPVTVAIFFAGLVLALRVGSFSVGKGGINATPRDQKKQPEPLLKGDEARIMFDALLKAMDHYKKIEDLQRTTLTDQMRAYEEAQTHAAAAFRRGFSVVLARLDLPTDVKRREAWAFAHMIKAITDDLKDEARKWFRINHYYTKSEEEWSRYKKMKRETIEHLISEAIDREWLSDIIDREELRTIGQTEKDDFDEIFEMAFDTARAISIMYFEEEQEVKARWGSEVFLLTGQSPYEKNCE